jgi:hypothetical protein
LSLLNLILFLNNAKINEDYLSLSKIKRLMG